jgi:DNA topoisomerase-3
MKADESSAVAVLAEKPSVARDIARVLGADKRGQGYLSGNGYVVTWAIGHLVSLAQPHEMNPRWKQWSFESLPMLPSAWPLVVYERTKDQFEVVRKILSSPRIGQIVCATDAGREGELIFRYIYEAAQSQKPVKRLWISSLTPEAIRKGFDKLAPGSEYDRLADAANGRSRADWLVGMNLSRAYSLMYREELSVGRVQTPTLAMLVDRELTLRNFNSEEYLEVIAKFQGHDDPKKESYLGTWFRPKAKEDAPSNQDSNSTGDAPYNKTAKDGQDSKEKESQSKSSRLPADGEEAKKIIARAKAGVAAIESVTAEAQRMQPPLLYDLTELQRHANRLFGFSAQQTLDFAQALYERHKLISYPRTDSRHISADVAATAPQIVAAVSAPYQKHLAPGTGVRPPSKRYVDDAKVTDHHAIIPNAVSAGRVTLSEQERKIYDLVCRRFFMMWHDDYLQAVTTVITAIRCEDIVDSYRTSGTLVQQVGWKVLDLAAEKKKKDGKAGPEEKEPEQVLPVHLAQGQLQDVAGVEAKKKKTKPPKRFTEGTLLTAMQTAGQSLDEKELSEAMKETGLGTPATRAATIETLLKRNYIQRAGKSLEATDKGIHLIEIVHPEVKSPAMTGQWEAFLKKIQLGESQLGPFLDGISDYVRSVVGKVRVTPPVRFAPRPPATTAPAASAPASRPKGSAAKEKPSGDSRPKTSLSKILKESFGHSKFLPHQKAVCQALVSGKDALLVLPAGSGKSLCYQLSGIALGGTTLVLSSQISRIEDQVSQLQQRGLAAECLHAGLDRDTSRRVCIEYLSGKLHFFFVTPERLNVAGVPGMLAKHKPSLVAVEDAHFVVQEDPDYRLLTQHLPALRPAPVLAISDMAVPALQKEIANQLGMADSSLILPELA